MPINKLKKDRKELVIPVNKGVIFPMTEVLLNFNDTPYLDYIELAMKQNTSVIFFFQTKNHEIFGTESKIKKIFRDFDGVRVLVLGEKRVSLTNFVSKDRKIEAEVVEANEDYKVTEKILALKNVLIGEMKIIANLGKSVDYMILINMAYELDPLALTYRICNLLDIQPEQKQELLMMNSLEEKMNRLNDFLAHEIKVLDIEKNIAMKTQEKINKTTKEAVLRERLEIIEQELGKNNLSKENFELQQKIKNANMPKEVETKALNELSRMSKMPSFNPEVSYIQSYLDWLTSLPWSIPEEQEVDIAKSKEILESDHYGLEKIKERILEYLAVIRLKSAKKQKVSASSNILCFVGPPGVGKTSMGRSIAKALGREFVSISLGGVRDEAEIKGHRRTYVGALPGRIIQGIRQSGTKNPVFMMDEIDKIGSSFMGNPAAALLEVLDPDQNSHFSDNYLEVPFDLSSVFFITTCNLTDTIPPALKDRLEIVNFSGYTETEKFYIAKNFLLEKELHSNGLDKNQLNIDKEALVEIIRRYTLEAGVRNLEREIAKICRKAATEIVNKKTRQVKITPSNIRMFLGVPKFKSVLERANNETGIASGLAWSENGGVVLPIEVAVMPGKGELLLTGHLGDVMKESCLAALSYIRSKSDALGLGLDQKYFKTHDIHIHVPEGAVQKDGPSAGIAITSALFSALANKKTKKDVGLSGEITLRGRVLEVGGVKEKVIAAQRSGLKTVILPSENKKDEEEIPEYVLKKINLVYINDINAGLKYILAAPNSAKERPIKDTD